MTTKMLVYAENWRDMQRWEKLLHACDEDDSLPFHTYCDEGESADGHVWCKTDRSKTVYNRLVSYNYPAHFKEMGIDYLTDVKVISWKSEREHIIAERYMHTALKKYRVRPKREWFSSQITGDSGAAFREFFRFHWVAASFLYGYVYTPLFGNFLQLIQAQLPELLQD